MTIRKYITQVALTLAVAPVGVMAGDSGAIYTQLSTNGLGIGYGTSVSEDWAVRGQYNFLKQSFSGNVGNFGANSVLDVKVDWSSFMILGDWYPSDGGFRLTGGVVLNNNKITVSGTGNVNNKAATVNGEIKMSDSLSPYLGLGYSTRPKIAKGLGFNFDLGVMVQDPKASLTATGAGVSAADIAAQQAQMQDAVNNLKYFPVLGLGVSYAF